jgi:hypothetical protein
MIRPAAPPRAAVSSPQPGSDLLFQPGRMTVSDQLDVHNPGHGHGHGPGPGHGHGAQVTAAKHKTNSEQKQAVPKKQELL